MSVSSLRLLHMLEAVCLTMDPTDLREITIPSTSGVARFILEMKNVNAIKDSYFVIHSLSNLPRQLDPQQPAGQRVDEYHEAHAVGGGHEVHEGEIFRVLDPLKPGHDDTVLALDGPAWAPGHLPSGPVLLPQLQRE